eukprot:5363629-Pyramimonas_sp.AAC.1
MFLLDCHRERIRPVTYATRAKHLPRRGAPGNVFSSLMRGSFRATSLSSLRDAPFLPQPLFLLTVSRFQICSRPHPRHPAPLARHRHRRSAPGNPASAGPPPVGPTFQFGETDPGQRHCILSTARGCVAVASYAEPGSWCRSQYHLSLSLCVVFAVFPSLSSSLLLLLQVFMLVFVA